MNDWWKHKITEADRTDYAHKIEDLTEQELEDDNLVFLAERFSDNIPTLLAAVRDLGYGVGYRHGRKDEREGK